MPVLGLFAAQCYPRRRNMRLIPSDPDIETIIGRIQSGDLDLQPAFQRGEVWSKTKKQRLIDSILRDWHVPPIHVIENAESSKNEVLDGQQRLAAIRDFVFGQFAIDGKTEPLDSTIGALDGFYYNDLPATWKRRFNQFTIRLFRIVDYHGGEPAELFFRLNQPSSLTGAEQRNAFFGPVRQQIKDLVEFLERSGLDKDFLGFSNYRMAYDDVLSRAALAIQRRSLAEKITATDLADLYRSDTPLSSDTVMLVRHTLSVFAEARAFLDGPPRFTKATLFTWLMFVVRAQLKLDSPLLPTELADFIVVFGDWRDRATRDPQIGRQQILNLAPAGFLITIYENRSSSRVSDVSSVLLRDAILWLLYQDHVDSLPSRKDLSGVELSRASQWIVLKNLIEGEDYVAKGLIESGWGSLK